MIVFDAKREVVTNLNIFSRCPICGSTSIIADRAPFVKFSVEDNMVECDSCGHIGLPFDFLPKAS